MHYARLLVLVVATQALGCASTILLNYSLLSTRSVDLSRTPTLEQRAIRTSGEDKTRTVTIIPIGTLSLQEAIDNALSSVPGCVALKDGTIKLEYGGLPFVYLESRIIVEGFPIIDPELAGKAGR